MKTTISASTLQHLRIPFSVYFVPVFLFALSQAQWNRGQATHIALLFIALHFFLYPASQGYNSYYDRDEKSIGGLENPPPVTSELKTVSFFLDALAVALGAWINLKTAAMIFLYGLISKAYSHPKIRLKKHPFFSWATVAIFQGAWIYLIVFEALDQNPSFLGPALASILVAGSYPLTQVYQHTEDAKRNDFTLSRLLGIRGTFIFATFFFSLAQLGFFYFFSLKDFILLQLFFIPIFSFFAFWTFSTWKNPHSANFKNAMKMNQISALCLSAFFILKRFFLLTLLLIPLAHATEVHQGKGYLKDHKTDGPWFLYEVQIDKTGTFSFSADPKNPSFHFIEEKVDLSETGTVQKYHYVQNQLQEEAWIEAQPGSKLLFRYKPKNGPEKKAIRDFPEKLIVPPMIVSVAQQNWKALMAGETYHFKIAAPDRLDYYSFKIFLDRKTDTQAIFKIKPASILVAAVVKPIYLTFDFNGRILHGEGLSPVKKAKTNGFEDAESEVDY